MMDLQTYFAMTALIEICAAAGEPESIKKIRRLVEGLMVIPQPTRAHLLAEGVNALAREQKQA